MTVASLLLSLSIASLLVATGVSADSLIENQNPAPQTLAPSAGRIQPAPGGGEMMFAGPDLEYIARAKAKSDTTLSLECDHADTEFKAPSDRE